ncbi:MAG TPA: sensor domain-containing diguanylate cyclase [Anaerolineales bacterium]
MADDKDFYKGIIDNLYDGVYFVDRERVISFWNGGAERITGYTSAQVMGHRCSDNILNHVTADGVQLCKTRCPLAACMADGKPREVDVFLHHADGHRVPVLVRAAPLRDADGQIIGAVETFSSDSGLSTVRRELRELRRTVQTDSLTGVGNRRYVERRLSGIIAEHVQQPDLMAALLFVDIDHFKRFNDVFSHEVGDKTLKMVAATLRHNTRETDVVGRWGGDEFIVILYDVSSREEAHAVAEKLRILVENCRLDLHEAHLTITLSVGATMLLPVDDAESVVRRADALMLQAKRAGGNKLRMD